MFQEAFSKKAKPEFIDLTIPVNSPTSVTDTTYLMFAYSLYPENNPLTLKIDGKEQKDDDGDTVIYRAVLIKIENYNELYKTTAYLVTDKNTTNTFASGTSTSCHVKFLARHSELYKYIAELAATFPNS